MSKVINLLNGAMGNIDGSEDGMDAVVGDIEEAIWTVEALLAAAKDLRAAQRAYMANRGNEDLGKKVAACAEALDKVLAEDAQ